MSIPMKDLLEDLSVEITGKDVNDLADVRGLLPVGTRINVTFLGSETFEVRRATAAEVKANGFVPVPHLSARRLSSADELDGFLGALQADGTCDHVFAVAGDPSEPVGPFASALDLIESASLLQHGISTVSLAGYPEGHPAIPDDVLWSALVEKVDAVAARDVTGDIITQFAFDIEPVLVWIEAVRERGIDTPIRIGVPGPAGVKRLLGYARRFGVGSSTTIARKYGLSLTNLLSTAGPDRFLAELADRLDSHNHGAVRLHFYTFGGLRSSAEWITSYRAQFDPALACD